MIATWWFRISTIAALALTLTMSGAAQAINHDIERTQTGSTVSDARLDQAMSVYENDQRLQQTRPEWEPELQSGDDPRSSNNSNPFFRAIADFFRAIGGILGYLLLGIIVLAILTALYLVFGDRIVPRWRKKAEAVQPDISEVSSLQPEQARARALLKDADALAAQGRFEEAVHLLLFRSIEDIQERRSGAVERALTAREIGALSILPEAVRAALLPIIRIVERSFFGGRNVTEDGWREARASYEVFAFGEAWS